MRYSIEPRDGAYVKGYGFLSLAKNLSDKYSQKRIETDKKSTTDALKTVSKRGIQKTAESTGDLIGNKIGNKITSISKKPVKGLPNKDETDDIELTTHKKKIYITKRKAAIYC